MTTVYVLVHEDRHTGVEIRVFTRLTDAVAALDVMDSDAGQDVVGRVRQQVGQAPDGRHLALSPVADHQIVGAELLW